jgi:hypothetical protein
MTDTDAGTVTQSSRVQGTQNMWLERLGCTQLHTLVRTSGIRDVSTDRCRRSCAPDSLLYVSALWMKARTLPATYANGASHAEAL